jgi:short-subunit dehydrogenase
MRNTDRPTSSGTFPLSGRVAVVTGAANGIGRALTIGLWRRGSHLALVDIDQDALSRVQSELQQAGRGRRLSVHVTDVGDRTQMRRLADDVVAAHGGVHLLINNAGVAHEGPFQRTGLDEWERVLGVNLWGVIHGCHFFLPHLARADRGWIVNLSSLLGVVAMPGQTPYSASKFAVRGFSEALRAELEPTSIGLTVVYPGAVATGIMRRARGDDPDLLRRIDDWYERNAMKPDRVADEILDAVERGSARVIIGPDARFADYITRLMPVAGAALFIRAAIRMLGVGYMRARRMLLWRESMRPDASDASADEESAVR